jgi:uncharacterized protein (TIGR00369 family)
LDDLDALRANAERIPYHAALGVRVEAIADAGARVRIPFRDDNANPGRALHGGVTASAIDIAASLAASSGFADAAALEASTLDLSVDYLAAAIGEDITAVATVLRRGKELTYCEVDVRTDAGKRVAIGLVTYRCFDQAANPGGTTRQLARVPGLKTASGERVKGAAMFVMAPFIARLGMQVTDAANGVAVLEMPCTTLHGDAHAALHEGALAALMDTAGALASWSLTGLDMRYKASTVGIHASYHAAAAEPVRAHACTVRRNNEIFSNQVTVVAPASGTLVATASVTYRIVVPA